MIEFLHGRVADLAPTYAVIECGSRLQAKLANLVFQLHDDSLRRLEAYSLDTFQRSGVFRHNGVLQLRGREGGDDDARRGGPHAADRREEAEDLGR